MKYKKIITFSFDDGVEQDKRFIEILNEYGLKCTFNINSGLMGRKDTLVIDGKNISHHKIKSEEVKSVYEGHEIAGHTLTHPHLTTVDDCEIIRQVEEDRLTLSSLVGYEIKGFAYPGGGVNCNDHVADVIRKYCGVDYARTIIHSRNFELQDDLYLFNPTTSLVKNKEELLSLANEFLSLKTDDLKMFYVWGHSYELDIHDDWQFFRDFCEMISGNDDILYCTNREAFDYMKNN
jgi:peptidoglycan/xylan/chitin deacetylase (PgdA/CDA1 family)